MRRATTFAVIALMLTGLTACSPPPSDPHPTAVGPGVETPGGATPTATPEPLIPDFVVVTAHSVSVGATTQEQIVDVPYTTAVGTAVTQLSEAIGAEPAVSTVAATGCSAAATIWNWGGLRLASPAPDGDRLGVQFIARVTAAETNGLSTELGYTDTVGSSLADIVAHNAGSDNEVVSEDLGGGHAVAMIDGQDGDTWGVIMVVESGRVSSFFAPGYFHSDDGMC